MTYCTGSRVSIRFRSPDTCTFSRWCSNDVPSYQGAASERVTTLSPCSAEIGMTVTSVTSRRAANTSNSSRMRSNAAWSQSTRSILFTATTMCGTPRSEVRNACRRLCSTNPLRASTRTIARSAVEAPVTMLRV